MTVTVAKRLGHAREEFVRHTPAGIRLALKVLLVGMICHLAIQVGHLSKLPPHDISALSPASAILVSVLVASPIRHCWAYDGSLLIVGFKSDKEKRAIYSMKPGEDPKPLSKEIGRLDGLYMMKDGTLLVTDWEFRHRVQLEGEVGHDPDRLGLQGSGGPMRVPARRWADADCA